MNKYLQKIADHLIDHEQLNHRGERKLDDGEIVECWHKNKYLYANVRGETYIEDRVDCFLYHHTEDDKNYIEFFFEESAVRYKSEDDKTEKKIIYNKITVDDKGVKAMTHNMRNPYNDKIEDGVRYISLKNFYKLKDDDLARKIMISSDDLKWIEKLPVQYYNIANGDTRKQKSLKEFVEFFAGGNVPKKLINIMEIPDIIYLASVIEENEFSKFTQYIYSIREKVDELKLPNILIDFYVDKFTNSSSKNMIRDYIELCRSTENRVNLNIKSYNRLKEEHDRMMVLSRSREMPDIFTKDIFRFENDIDKEINFELIDGKTRLLNESIMMHNCVNSYDYRINNGQCGIYHVTYEGKGYTLEVGNRKGLKTHQLRGNCNESAPEDLHNKVDKILAEINSKRKTQVNNKL